MLALERRLIRFLEIPISYLRGVAAVYLTEDIFMATPMLLSQPNSFVIRIITHL